MFSFLFFHLDNIRNSVSAGKKTLSVLAEFGIVSNILAKYIFFFVAIHYDVNVDAPLKACMHSKLNCILIKLGVEGGQPEVVLHASSVAASPNINALETALALVGNK